jgi:signal transduction histidine kinase
MNLTSLTSICRYERIEGSKLQISPTCARLEAHSAADKVVTAVRDDGPSTTQEHQARAFDRFNRGTSDSAGAGLGLAFVK